LKGGLITEEPFFSSLPKRHEALNLLEVEDVAGNEQAMGQSGRPSSHV